MPVRQIVIAAVYLLLVVAYILTSFRPEKLRRKAIKVLMASLYFFYAVLEFGHLFRRDDLSCLVILTALAFCMLGDIFIMFSFFRGALLFAIGNLFFIAFEILFLIREGTEAVRLLSLLPLVAMPVGTVAILDKRKWIRLGKLRTGALGYLIAVTVDGMLGLILAALYGGAMRILGIGLGLFMVSDYFLYYREFRKNRHLADCVNTATYFPGMLLASLSVYYFMT